MQIDDRKPFERRFYSLKQEYESWKPTHKEIRDFIDPSLGFFEGEQPNRGDKLNHKILLHNTTVMAASTLAAGFKNGLTPQSSVWFKLRVSDPDLNQFEPVKVWLNIARERMMEVFSQSNIYNVFHSMFLELGVFGTAAGLISEDYDDVIRGRAFTAGEYFLGTGPDLRVNSLGRIVWMTAIQMVEAFGIDNVRIEIKNAYNENKYIDVWFPVYHLIEPNDQRVDNKKDFKNMKFRSVYWDPADSETVLRMGGYRVFPVIAPRWKTVGSNAYSKNAPGWHALGNSKTSQKMRELQLKALHKLVDPPLTAPSGIRKSGGVNALPNGITWTDNSAPDASVRATYQVRYPAEVENTLQDIKNEIKETFYNHLFVTVIDQPHQRTAYEVAKIWEEKLGQIGPVVENVEAEMLDPAIDRVFDIMLAAGLFPEPPKELQDQDLNVEYVSMLALAQKMATATSIQQTAQFIGALAQFKPEVIDKGNWDEMIDLYSEIVGTPPNIILSDEIVARMRAERAKQAQVMQQAQMAANVIDGAKTLSETNMDGKNALTALLGGEQAG